MPEELTAPRTSVELEDNGLKDVESSDESSDQFTDASEGRRRAASQASDRSQARSPIPITRVERVDDEPAYGEVPGTDAYKKRTQDAVPDVVEVVNRSRSASRVADPPSPSNPIPKIVAMKIDPDVPGYGDIPGTEAYEQRKADAQPDVILKSPQDTKPPPNPWSAGKLTDSHPSDEFLTKEGSPTASLSRSHVEKFPSHESQSSSVNDADVEEDGYEVENEDEHDEGFGDDFDDFEQEQEGDDDFGDFDDGFQDGFGVDGSMDTSPDSVPVAASSIIPIPSLDWSEIDGIEDLESALEPYLNQLYPDAASANTLQAPSPPSQTFLSDRSLSLYQQLIAPPPLAPPNWLRSRIRRLFFVSLGVPVDLDEILPASKQKKLILPSINFPERSPRHSADSRTNSAVARLKEQNSSTLSIDSSGNGRKSPANGARRRGGREAEIEPRFDAPEALRLANTTEAKLQGLSVEELMAHVTAVEECGERARETLGYWQRLKESAEKEKEAFEGVIENLVKHARKVRK